MNSIARLVTAGIAAALAATVTVPAAAAIGPHAARCDAGGASVIVNVTGFRARTGNIRVQIYDANPRTFLERGQYLTRVELPVTRSGEMAVCMPVPSSGRYVVSVRHDADGNGRWSDRSSDGGGFSGNPNVSIMDLVLKRKPSLSRVGFDVGDRPARLTVVLNYVSGTSFRPVS